MTGFVHLTTMQTQSPYNVSRPQHNQSPLLLVVAAGLGHLDIDACREIITFSGTEVFDGDIIQSC